MALAQEDKTRLYDQLVKLGDMMGDSLHLEPDGKWISREYRQVLKQLGLTPKISTDVIDKFMNERILVVKCSCGKDLKQVRKGSFVAKCTVCESRYRLGKKAKQLS